MIFTRRHSTSIGPCGLLTVALLLFGGTVATEAQRADQSPADAPGVAWRLVRGGGGLASPQGTTGMDLQGVASNGDRYVVVGDAGTIAHSSDGNLWVEASGFGATENWLNDVVWGNDRFVAVGDYTIIHSSDGDRWQSARRVDWYSLASVACGNQRFVAVGDGGTAVLSDDGIHWREARESVARANLSSVAWGGDRFVAVGNDGMIVHSEDGDRWQPAGDTGISTALYGVAWSGNRFVAVGGDTILHSSDGDRWQPASSLAGGHSGWLHDVAWSGGRFVAVGDYAVLHSSDGDRWQPAPLAVENPLTGVAGNGRGFVAVGWGGAILHSSDGILWDAATEAGAGVPLPALDGVAWSGERFVAVGGRTDSIVHSLDGEHWQEASRRDDLYGRSGVAWAGDRFVAVGHSIGLSEDGIRWRQARVSVHGDLTAVAWNGERHVAVGSEGLIVHSDSGDWWSPATDSATAETLTDVAWNGERFVAVGHHGAIVHSSDGDHWLSASLPAVPFRAARSDDDPYAIYYYFSGIVWNGVRFVAVGWGGNDNLGTVVLSSDGDRWELAADHDHLADEHFEAVAWGGERFVAVSYFDGTIMYSEDGDRWELATEIATVDTLEDVTWGNGRFVAVGRNGTIVTSP